MKYDFSQVKLVGIEGEALAGPPAHKILADILYRSAKTLDLVETARKMNTGVPVEFDKAEIMEVRELIQNPRCGLFAFVQKALLDYINETQLIQMKE